MPFPTILDTFVERTPGSSSSDTFNFTVSSGNNKLLVFLFASPGGGRITSATFNGVSLICRSFTTNQYYVNWGYLVNPDVGTYSFVANYPSQTRPLYRVFTLQNVDQINPYNIDGNANGSSGTVTKGLTTTTNNTLILSMAISSYLSSSIYSNHTALWSSSRPYGAGNEIWAGGYQTQALPGTYNSSFTRNTTGYSWEELVIAFNYDGNTTIKNSGFLQFF